MKRPSWKTWLLGIVAWSSTYLLVGTLFHEPVTQQRNLSAVESAVAGVSVIILLRYFFSAAKEAHIGAPSITSFFGQLLLPPSHRLCPF